MKNKYFILAITFLCLLMGQISFGQLDPGDFTGGGRDNVLYQFDASTGLMNPLEGAELDTWKDENGMMYATDDTGNLYADINDDGHFDKDEDIDWESNMTNPTSDTTTNTSNTSSSSSNSEGSWGSWGGGYAGLSTGGSGDDDNNDSSNLIASTDNSTYSGDGGFVTLSPLNYTGNGDNNYLVTENSNPSPTNTNDQPLYFNQGNILPPIYPNPDPCAEEIKQAFNGLTQQGKLAEILSKFTGANAKYEIKISAGPIANGVLANTDKFNIVFNQDYPKATIASKTASLIHEYIHAYFNALYEEYKITKDPHIYDDYPYLKAIFVGGQGGNRAVAHHDQIVASFFDTMVDVLKQLQPNIVIAGNPDQFYTDMVWGTLQGTPAYDNSNLSPEDKERISSRRAMERDNEPRGANTPMGKPCNK